jgi:hypothetical protein
MDQLQGVGSVGWTESDGGVHAFRLRSRRRHPEAPRFHQRGEGSRADLLPMRARSFDPPEMRLRSG